MELILFGLLLLLLSIVVLLAFAICSLNEINDNLLDFNKDFNVNIRFVRSKK